MTDFSTYKLSEIARSTKGKKPKSVSKEKTDGFEIPYVDIKAFEKGIVDNYTDGENCTFCKPDDVLIVWDGARCGFVGRGVEGAIGSTLAKISSDKYTNDFLFYFLQSKYKVLNSNPRGVGIPHIESNLLWNFEIPDVDKTTQRAIVSRIETLFAELDKAVQHLRTAQQQLKTYRQAVLNHSFSNETWENVSITDIIEKEKNSLKAGPFGSSLKKEYYVEDGYKVYGQEQVISGDPFIGNYYIDEDKYKELESCKIKSGDVLISLVGTVGKILILPENIKPGIINPRLIKITLNRQMYDSKFFKYYFESSQVKSFYKINASGTTMDVLNIGIIKQIPFPLPPLAEQQRIVKEIESCLSQASASSAYIENALQQAEALRQSILKKAFSGELV